MIYAYNVVLKESEKYRLSQHNVTIKWELKATAVFNQPKLLVIYLFMRAIYVATSNLFNLKVSVCVCVYENNNNWLKIIEISVDERECECDHNK